MERNNNNDPGAKFCIVPFDENGNSFPLIQYERFDGLNRIYASTATMYGAQKAAVKNILAKIKNWIKENAQSHHREGSFLCGITIYDISSEGK